MLLASVGALYVLVLFLSRLGSPRPRDNTEVRRVVANWRAGVVGVRFVVAPTPVRGPGVAELADAAALRSAEAPKTAMAPGRISAYLGSSAGLAAARVEGFTSRGP